MIIMGIFVGWKRTFGVGATNGAIIAIMLILLIILGDLIFDFFPIIMLSFLLVILIPPFISREIWKEGDDVYPSLFHAIPVSFLTFIFPLLGPVFGGGDMGLDWLILIPIGAAGGTFWSIPFAIVSYFKERKRIEEE